MSRRRTPPGTFTTPLVVLLVVTLGWWALFGGLLGVLATGGFDRSSPPPASSLPTVGGVEIDDTIDQGWGCGGTCSTTVLLAHPTDGARRAVVVHRILGELRQSGWHVAETEEPDEAHVTAAGPIASAEVGWTDESGRAFVGRAVDYDPDHDVLVALEWSGDDRPMGADAVSFDADGPAAKGLGIAIALTASLVVLGAVALVARRRSDAGQAIVKATPGSAGTR